MPYAVPAKRVEEPEQVARQSATGTTTTTFSIDLMDACMGMKRFTTQSNTPTATSAKATLMSGKRCSFRAMGAHGPCGFLIRRKLGRVALLNLFWFTSRWRLHWCEQLQRSPSETSASNPAQGLHPRGEHGKSDGCHRLPAWSLHPAERQRHRD
jgi:hypothetical protein